MGIERIKWNIAGFKALRNERGVMSDLIERGQAIVSASGSGFKIVPVSGKNRARVSVLTDTPEAKIDNAKNNTLIRNLDAGR